MHIYVYKYRYLYNFIDSTMLFLTMVYMGFDAMNGTVADCLLSSFSQSLVHVHLLRLH